MYYRAPKKDMRSDKETRFYKISRLQKAARVGEELPIKLCISMMKYLIQVKLV